MSAPLNDPLLISDFFPKGSRLLLTGGGRAFVEQLGIEAIKRATLAILSGDNIRTQTEPLTRRRIAMVSAAMVQLFAQGWQHFPNFKEEINQLAVNQLKAKRTGKTGKWIGQWLLGLTDKQYQNVLRGNSENLTQYVAAFEQTLREAANRCYLDFGAVPLGAFQLPGEQEINLDWLDILQMLTAVGSLTLALRGSDKSLYGKLFERLVLGSVLSILGFEQVNPTTNQKTSGVFWLSDSRDTRESDATLLYQPGKVARFDIGFIGVGNSEISKDKLSRYAREFETHTGRYESNTFIIVDRLPQTSKTLDEALRIGSSLTQMSMQYWPRQLAQALGNRFGFKHPLQQMPDSGIQPYLQSALSHIPVENFVSGLSVDTSPANE